LPYAEPLTFLALRFALVAASMLVASLALGLVGLVLVLSGRIAVDLHHPATLAAGDRVHGLFAFR